MAQLNWKQVAAPDLSGTSRILANANQSFNAGLANASSLLDSYNEGQQEKNDNALLGEIASLNSEEELGAFLSGDALKGKNISSTMRENILGLRKGILANESTRASTAGTKATTANTYARTAIAQAAEGRQAAEYKDGVAARTELRGLTGVVAGANQEGNLFGRDGTYTPNYGNGPTVKNSVFQGLLARGIPEHVAHGFMMNFQDESGFNVDITEGEPNVHGTRGKGLYQLTGSRRNAFEAKYGNDYSIDNQLDWLVAELQGSESKAAQKIFNTRSAGEAGSAIVSSFLRPAEQHRVERSNKYSQSVGKTQPKFNALQNAIQQSVYLTPDQATGFLGDAYKAQSAGQKRIDAASAAVRSERSAGAILAGIQDPTITSRAGLTDNLLANSDFQSANERLSAVERGAALADGPLASTLRPSVAPDALIDATVKETLAADQRSLDALPQTVILERAGRFEADPTQSLIDELSLGSDGNNPQTFLFGLLGENFDEVDVTRKINEVARAAGVSPAMAAAGMVEKFKRDPFRNNTLDRRFVEDEIVSYIKETMSPEAMTRYGNQRIRTERRSDEIQGATLQLDTLRAQAAKYPPGQVPAGITAQIETLRDTIAEGATPEEARIQLQSYIRENGMAQRLQSLDPNSADYQRAIGELEQYIQIDPDLSQKEKTLLMLTIKG